MEHTPGPWFYRPNDYDDWGIVRAGNGIICQARSPKRVDEETLAQHRVSKTDPWEADARLIAAAPELLEALEMVRDADDDCKRDGLVTIPGPARAKIDAAIAKATTP